MLTWEDELKTKLVLGKIGDMLSNKWEIGHDILGWFIKNGLGEKMRCHNKQHAKNILREMNRRAEKEGKDER